MSILPAVPQYCVCVCVYIYNCIYIYLYILYSWKLCSLMVLSSEGLQSLVLWLMNYSNMGNNYVLYWSNSQIDSCIHIIFKQLDCLKKMSHSYLCYHPVKCCHGLCILAGKEKLMIGCLSFQLLSWWGLIQNLMRSF